MVNFQSMEKKDTACLLSPADADDAVGDAF